MILYGTFQCPDVRTADKVLRKNGVYVEFRDVSSLRMFKEFLQLRDSREEFNKIKEEGKIGIPAFVLDDGSIEFDVCKLEGVKDCSIYEEYIKEKESKANGN